MDPCRIIRTLIVLLILFLAGAAIPITDRVYSGDRLDPYRNLIGSLVEKKVLHYVRACIIHELEPESGVPDGVKALPGLPQTGLYMTLMKGLDVRACIGRFTPYSYSMEKAIEDLAREITFGDIRYRPLSPGEMEDLRIVLSFVGPMKEIRDPYTIDFAEEGLYIGQDGKGGVLLPGETRTLEYGIKRLMRQHGMDPKKAFRYASFKVIVFDERRDK